MIHEQQEFFILLHFTSKFNLMFSFVFHACLLQLEQHSKMSNNFTRFPLSLKRRNFFGGNPRHSDSLGFRTWQRSDCFCYR